MQKCYVSVKNLGAVCVLRLAMPKHGDLGVHVARVGQVKTLATGL